MTALMESLNPKKHSLAAELSFCIHGHKNHFKFDVESSKPLAVIGVSGSGKSSLLKALSCFDNSNSVYSESKITLNERGFSGRESATNPCVYVSDDQPLLARKNVLYALNSLSQSSKAFYKSASSLSDDELIKRLELESVCNTPVEQLSAGQRQRLRIGLALMSNKPIVILDEMLSNLDLSLRQKVLSYLTELHQQQKRFIILVSHQSLELLAYCEHAISVADFEYSPPRDIFTALQTQLYFKEHPFSLIAIQRDKLLKAQETISGIKGEFPISQKYQTLWFTESSGVMLVPATDVVICQFKEADCGYTRLNNRALSSTQEYCMVAKVVSIESNESFTLVTLALMSNDEPKQTLKSKVPTSVYRQINATAEPWLQVESTVLVYF